MPDVYDGGDDNIVMKDLRRLADQGDARAQYNLGLMYQLGLGVPQDDQEAAQWCRLAGEQGHAGAQIFLGAMYHLGQGVPRDDVLAHMWVNLAAVQGNEGAAKGVEILEKEMTPDQLAEAQRLAREWKPKGE